MGQVRGDIGRHAGTGRGRRGAQPLRLLAMILVLLATAAPAALRAQEFAGQTIQKIDVQGLVSLPTDTLLYYLDLKQGQPFDPTGLNEKIHDLWKRGLIDDLKVDAEPVQGGIDLTLTVKERPILRSIVYQGLKKVSKTDINDRMAQDHVQVVEGGPLDRGELERLRVLIQDLYRERGYRLAQAQYHLETVSPTDRRAVFTVDEGDKVRIADIKFEGNKVFSDRRLRWAMKKTKETGPIARIRKHDIYNPATLAEDLDLVKKVYRNDGYKNVHLGEPDIEVRPLHPKAKTATKQKRRLFLTIPVEEGERWKMGTVSIEGNKKYTDEQLLSLFKRPRGDWLQASKVDDFVKSVTDIYNNTGFIQANVVDELVEKENHVANVVIHIAEGDQFKVGRMEFEGNTKTRDKVLRRQMLIQETRVFNTGALRNSLRRIGQLQYWKVDKDDPVKIDVDNEDKTVDVTVNGQEGDRTEVQFGAGWSELEGFFGQFQIQSRNFLGRGETLGASYSSGRYSNTFDLSYAAPWFLDRPQSFGIQVYKRNLDYSLLTGTTFIQNSEGGTVSYGRNVGIFGSAGFSVTHFNARETQQYLDPFTGQLQTYDYNRAVNIIHPNYSFDNRDNPLFPTKGISFDFGVDYAGGVLGGSTDYVRPETSFSAWIPVTNGALKTVFGAHVRIGRIIPFNNSQLFFSDRYYLGGEQTLRGFRYRTIWVRDKNDQTIFDSTGLFPLGGEKMFQYNMEYHLVLGEPFRLLAFLDAGNVWSADQNYDIGNLRYSAGLELRIFVPVLGAPLRFIYAKDLNPLPDDRFDSFTFSIGTTF